MRLSIGGNIYLSNSCSCSTFSPSCKLNHMHPVQYLQPFSKAEIHPLIYEFDTPITIEGECVLRNDHSVNGYRPTVGLFGHLHIPIMHFQ